MDTPRISVKLSKDLHQRIAILAKLNGASIAWYLDRIVRQYLDRREKA